MSVPEKVEEILATRREGDNFVILGINRHDVTDMTSSYRIICNTTSGEILEDERWKRFAYVPLYVPTLGLVYLLPSVRRAYTRDREFIKHVNEYKTANMAELGREVAEIPIFQLSMEEAERVLRRPLEVVDTGRPTKFLEAEAELGYPNDFWLRVRALEIGPTNALVCYQAGAPARATPVRYADKNE